MRYIRRGRRVSECVDVLGDNLRKNSDMLSRFCQHSSQALVQLLVCLEIASQTKSSNFFVCVGFSCAEVPSGYITMVLRMHMLSFYLSPPHQAQVPNKGGDDFGAKCHNNAYCNVPDNLYVTRGHPDCIDYQCFDLLNPSVLQGWSHSGDAENEMLAQ